MLSSTVRPRNRRDCWYVRASPSSRALPRGSVRHVPAEELDRPDVGGKSPADDVEERRLAGAVRAEDRPALAGRDVEVDVADGVEAAEAPADPPQAEGRLGVFGCVLLRSTAYLMTWFVITPFLTTLILPCHGIFFLHGGCVRPGGGLVGLKSPPNDWSTFGHVRDDLSGRPTRRRS